MPIRPLADLVVLEQEGNLDRAARCCRVTRRAMGKGITTLEA